MNNKEKIQILCIDDEEHYISWERAIRRVGSYDYDFTNLKGSNNVLNKISSNDVKIAILDMNLGAGKKFEGIETAKLIKNNYPDIYIILATQYGAVQDDRSKDNKKEEIIVQIKDALENKSIDYYIDKEYFVSQSEEIIKTAIESINNPQKREIIRQERIRTLKLIKDYKVDKADDEIISKRLVGNSKSIQLLKKWIVKFANANDPIPVLIIGETGTGKEVVANLIHELSPRKDEKFVPVNCAAIPETLIESELFGHVKGAFTDATFDKTGKFQLAHKGSLFLDEISELSLLAQAKILRAIQEKKIDKVGGQDKRKKRDQDGSEKDIAVKELNIPVDVRIICATNKDLKGLIEKEINDKTTEMFRHDLFYRISGFHLKLVPLRDRTEDIPDLVNCFINKKDASFTPKSIVVLQEEYDWPGNIRELKSFIDNLINLFPEKTPFDVETVQEALELWKGMHPNTNYLFAEERANNDETGLISKINRKVNLNVSKYQDAFWVITMLNNACKKTIEAASNKNIAYKRIEEVKGNIKEKQLAKIKEYVDAGKFDNLAVIGLFCQSKAGQKGMAFEGVYDYMTSEFFDLCDSKDSEVLAKVGDISPLRMKLSKTLENKRFKLEKQFNKS